MGECLSCCFGGSVEENDPLQPDPETKRRQMAEAAEKRLQENESRGIKNPGRLQEKQKRLEALEENAARRGDSGVGLKWNVG